MHTFSGLAEVLFSDLDNLSLPQNYHKKKNVIINFIQIELINICVLLLKSRDLHMIKKKMKFTVYYIITTYIL
ncbi:unnamed protein product [Rhizophagus irregularis]|uniref:Uncharacterized protein n=1 Tax=Rhizophagus irregularis TaxID=588596 RepID=A0A916E5X9_9GLOM|nr:unnamed protein product [Rhizophagus irregularis]CAB5362232.1 unnamed protein product [Rhizophagus irregularis]